MPTWIYPRISSKQQTEASQIPDLKQWEKAQAEPCEWERDSFTGTTMSRPGWERVWAAVLDGRCNRVVVWRLDRLGRTTPELSALFAELIRRNVTLVSLREGFDLSTPGGRLFAHILASVAQYETEVRSERQLAGIAAAKAAGAKFGRGHKKDGLPTGQGKRIKVDPSKAELIHRLKGENVPIARIARNVGLSRGTVYSVLAEAQPGLYLVFSGVKGQGEPVYAIRAPDEAAARRIAVGQHPLGTRFRVVPDDGTAARLKLVVLAATIAAEAGAEAAS